MRGVASHTQVALVKASVSRAVPEVTMLGHQLHGDSTALKQGLDVASPVFLYPVDLADPDRHPLSVRGFAIDDFQALGIFPSAACAGKAKQDFLAGQP